MHSVLHIKLQVIHLITVLIHIFEEISTVTISKHTVAVLKIILRFFWSCCLKPRMAFQPIC